MTKPVDLDMEPVLISPVLSYQWGAACPVLVTKSAMRNIDYNYEPVTGTDYPYLENAVRAAVGAYQETYKEEGDFDADIQGYGTETGFTYGLRLFNGVPALVIGGSVELYQQYPDDY